MFNSCFGVVGYSLPYLVPYLVCTNIHNLPLLKLNIHMIEEVLINVNLEDLCPEHFGKKKKKKRPMTQYQLARFCYYHNEKAGSHDSSFPVGAYSNPVFPRGAEPVDGMGSMQSASD